jgi:hypothetical protein
MKMTLNIKLVVIFSLLLVNINFCFSQNLSKIKGITLVAPPRPIDNESVKRIAETNSDWIALVPYGFQRQNDKAVQYNVDGQWWGERAEGVNNCIDLAHSHNQKVMLKPQIWIHGLWVGDLDFKTEAEWLVWEEGYRGFINSYVDMAIAKNVEMFCIGTEIRNSVSKREKFWRGLIKEIRVKYKGKLTYSANWDDFKQVPFWDALDFIGISAYFPLSDVATPSVFDLTARWKMYSKDLKDYSKKYKRQILFTEYGYLTVDQCAYKTWELEKRVKTTPENQQAQANAFQALYLTFWKESYWAGGFIWKWFPNGMGRAESMAKEYTPKDKLAEAVVSEWYGKP